MKTLIFLFLVPLTIYSQIQIGDDIYGEAIYDQFGWSVSMSSDGQTIAVGAPKNDGNGNRAGHVRVFKNESGSWVQVGDDIDGEAAGDQFGYSISLSSDGNIVAIGALDNDGNGDYSGHVRIYKNENSVWTQIGDDIDGETARDASGGSVSLSSNGNIVAIGAYLNGENGYESGHVRIFENQNDVWTQLGDDIDGEAAGDQSGLRVSLSNDGYTVAVAAHRNDGTDLNSGHVRVFKNESGSWVQIGDNIDGESAFDESGYSLSLSGNGNIVAIGAQGNDENGQDSGHVRIYKNENDVWTQIGEDIDGEVKGDNFGSSVSLSNDGNIIAIGAHRNDATDLDSGHVRVFKNESGSWVQIGEDIEGESELDFFGWSLSISSDGNTVAIGADSNDGNGIDSGHVRVYDLTAVLSNKSYKQDYFSMYPNPVQDKVQIQLNSGQNLEQVNIYTVEGQYLYSEQSLELNMSHLSSGIYVLEVKTNEGKSAKKIIKK